MCGLSAGDSSLATWVEGVRGMETEGRKAKLLEQVFGQDLEQKHKQEHAQEHGPSAIVTPSDPISPPVSLPLTPRSESSASRTSPPASRSTRSGATWPSRRGMTR